MNCRNRRMHFFMQRTQQTPAAVFRFPFASSLLSISFLFVLAGLPAIGFSQSPNQLDLLIFEPAYIDENGVSQSYSRLQTFNFLSDDPGYSTTAENNRPTQSRAEINRNIDAYRQALSDIESESGPFSQDLYETLLDLGTQYQQLGDHEAAIEIFERAEHISRINNGLFHPEQFASIEKMIESYLAIGDVITANQKQRYLVYLSQEHFGARDINTLPSLLDLADRNMTSFTDTLNGPTVPTISFSSGNNASGPGGAPSRTPTARELAFRNLFVAQQSYFRAIATMLDNEQYFNPLLLDLEYRFLETLFLQSFRMSIVKEPDYYLSERRHSTGSLITHDFNRRFSSGYAQGKNAFERIIIYISNNPDARLYQLVNALMEFGDWNMLFGRSNTAQDKYLEAYNLVNQMNVNQENIESLFRPAIPVHLPLFTAKPNSREKFDIPQDQQLDHEGYIDIAFTISRFGRAKRFDVLDASENSTSSIERRLRRFLRNSPFRPRLDEAGEFTEQRVTLRYYFSYAEAVI